MEATNTINIPYSSFLNKNCDTSEDKENANKVQHDLPQFLAEVLTNFLWPNIFDFGDRNHLMTSIINVLLVCTDKVFSQK